MAEKIISSFVALILLYLVVNNATNLNNTVNAIGGLLNANATALQGR